MLTTMVINPVRLARGYLRRWRGKWVMAMAAAFLHCASISVSGVVSAQTSLDAKRQKFPVFDATIYSNKPDLSVYGIRKLPVIYTHHLWPYPRQNEAVLEKLPSPDFAKRGIAKYAADAEIVCLDIEFWKITGRPEVVSESLGRLITLVQWVRETSPKVRVGYYGFPPIRDYWRALKGEGSPEYRAWQRENEALRPLSEAVDVLFPSLYTFYPDVNGWTAFAKAQIKEARRINKPVYVFLWPQFHNSSKQAYKFLPRSYWAAQLALAREHADGIVIWGGWTGSIGKDLQIEWDENAEWWLETKDFMERLRTR